MFSYVGMDIFAATAAESRALSDSESIKMAARKINIRVITLYAFAVLVASFVVPTDHAFINGAATSIGARSVFVIAVVEAGMPTAAHFFNAMFVFSAFTCAINNMYVASRVLHTLALRGQTGPEWITRRLRQCRSGVPIRTVLVTGALMLIGFMGRSGSPGAVSGPLPTPIFSLTDDRFFDLAPGRAGQQLHRLVPHRLLYHLRDVSLLLQGVRTSSVSDFSQRANNETDKYIDSID